MARPLHTGLVFVALAILAAPPAAAQQRIAYVDSEYLLIRIPEYATVQQEIDRLAAGWERELSTMQTEVEEQFREYQARELLYTNEERNRRREEIMQAEDEVERQRVKYFGPEGDLFLQQEQLMRPIQERILAAIEEVATSGGYDYVFDKAGDYLFLFTRPQYDLSDRVLEELGIDVEQIQRR
jgi:outer membrane protein